MPVLLVTDSTAAYKGDGWRSSSLLTCGGDVIIQNPGASLASADASSTFPATLMSLLAMHVEELLGKYGTSTPLKVVALRLSGSIPPSKDCGDYSRLAAMRRRAGLCEFPWELSDLDALLKSSGDVPLSDERRQRMELEFPRVRSHSDASTGLWSTSSAPHIRPCLLEAFRSDLLELGRGHHGELLLIICAGWNATDLERELEAHAILASASSMGSLQRALASYVSGMRAHLDWLPLLRATLLSHRRPERVASSDVVFILSVDPSGLGAASCEAWAAAGFRPHLVSGELPFPKPRQAASPAHLAWQLLFLPTVYEATMQFGEDCYIFMAEDSARPAPGLTQVELLRRLSTLPPSLGYWLGVRQYKKRTTEWQAGRVLPGGKLDGNKCKAPSAIGSKFFAVTRKCIRYMFAAGLQSHPWGYRDHLNGCLLASGLMCLAVPSVTTSAGHCSHQLNGRWIEHEDASAGLPPGAKIPTWKPLSPAAWRSAELCLMGGDGDGGRGGLEPVFSSASVTADRLCFDYDGAAAWRVSCSTGLVDLLAGGVDTPPDDGPAVLPSSAHGAIWVAKAGYTAEQEGYLTVECGTRVQELPPPEEAGGWAYVENCETGVRGWVPPSFFEECV